MSKKEEKSKKEGEPVKKSGQVEKEKPKTRKDFGGIPDKDLKKFLGCGG